MVGLFSLFHGYVVVGFVFGLNNVCLLWGFLSQICCVGGWAKLVLSLSCISPYRTVETPTTNTNIIHAKHKSNHYITVEQIKKPYCCYLIIKDSKFFLPPMIFCSSNCSRKKEEKTSKALYSSIKFSAIDGTVNIYKAICSTICMLPTNAFEYILPPCHFSIELLFHWIKSPCLASSCWNR